MVTFPKSSLFVTIFVVMLLIRSSMILVSVVVSMSAVVVVMVIGTVVLVEIFLLLLVVWSVGLVTEAGAPDVLVKGWSILKTLLQKFL